MDNCLKFCFDYRRLNDTTVQDRYSIPWMDWCINPFEEAQIFSISDANFGYWKVQTDERGVDKTAFVTRMV